jgi:hypothetical protein
MQGFAPMLVPEHVVPKFRFQAKEGYVLFQRCFPGRRCLPDCFAGHGPGKVRWVVGWIVLVPN